MQQHGDKIREIIYGSAAPVVLMNTYINTQIKNCNTRWVIFCLCLSVLYFALYIHKKPSEKDMAEKISEVRTQYNRALVENTNEIHAAIKTEYQKELDFKVDSLEKAYQSTVTTTGKCK